MRGTIERTGKDAETPYRLPRRFSVTGRALGAVLYRLAAERRRIAIANTVRAFPELDSALRRRLVQASFAHAGAGVVEALLAFGGHPPARRRFVFRGAEHVDAALAKGQGVVLLQARFSCLDAAASAIEARWPVTAVSGFVADTRVGRFVRRRRARLLSGIVDNDDLSGMLAVLRRGEVLWLCPDVRVPRARCGFPSSYFGQRALSSAAPALLARLTGAALVPCVPLREGSGYRLQFGAPLSTCARTAETTQRINDLFEAQVRAAPEQYLWMNRRFEAQSRRRGRFA